MRGEREVDELLDQLGILAVPGVNELQLPARIDRLDALDTCELRSGMPDELVENGRPPAPLGSLRRTQG